MTHRSRRTLIRARAFVLGLDVDVAPTTTGWRTVAPQEISNARRSPSTSSGWRHDYSPFANVLGQRGRW